LDASGKEKADMIHIKCDLRPQDTIKVKSDNKLDYKSAGECNRQSQDDKHRYKLHVVEDHEEKG